MNTQAPVKRGRMHGQRRPGSMLAAARVLVDPPTGRPAAVPATGPPGHPRWPGPTASPMSHPTGGYRLPTGHKACSTSSPVHLGQQQQPPRDELSGTAGKLLHRPRHAGPVRSRVCDGRGCRKPCRGRCTPGEPVNARGAEPVGKRVDGLDERVERPRGATTWVTSGVRTAL